MPGINMIKKVYRRAKNLWDLYHGDALVISAIMISQLIFFSRSIFLGQIPSPTDILSQWVIFDIGKQQIQNGLLSDVIVQFNPWLWFNWLCFHNLQFPLWNTFCAAGVPLLGNMQSTVFFVLTWPIYIFGLSRLTLLIYYFSKLFLISILTFYYLRSIKLDKYSSLLGSLAFTYANFNVVWLYYPLSNAIIILPVIFYLTGKIFNSKGDEKPYIALAFVYAIGIFAGSPETFFHVLLISILYFVFKLITASSTLFEKLNVVKKCLFYSFLGAALSAVQLMPFIEYLMNSYIWTIRSNYGRMLDWHTSILNFIPEYYGAYSIHYNAPVYIFPSYTNYNEAASGYVGISLICLALFALVTRYKDQIVQFYAMLAVLSAGIVYGAPLIFDTANLIPLLSSAANTRLLFSLGFSVAVLGSCGMNKIISELDGKESRKSQVIFTICSITTVAVLLGLAFVNSKFIYHLSLIDLAYINENILGFQIREVLSGCTILFLTLFLVIAIIYMKNKPLVRKASFIALFVLILWETCIHGMLFEPAVDENLFYPKVAAFEVIKGDEEPFRTTSISPEDSVYPVNTQMMYGIYDIRNYDTIENRYYKELFDSLANGMLYAYTNIHDIDHGFLNFLGVKWVFSKINLSNESEWTSQLQLEKEYDKFYVFRNLDVMPRAFIVQNVIFSSSDTQVLETLRNKSFDWAHTVIISGENGTNQSGSPVQNTLHKGTAHFVEYKPTYVRIDAYADTPAYLVISDSYYPGWNAYLNGSKVEILRANYAFRSVKLGQGYSTVEFKYEPASFYIGAIVSLIALLGLLYRLIRPTARDMPKANL